MKELRNVLLGIAFCLSVATVFAQQPGSTVAYQVTPNVYFCSAQGAQYINCDGIPFTLQGTPIGSMWLYTNFNAFTGTPYGWGFFFGPNPMAGDEFTITSSSFNPSSLTSVHQGYPYAGPPYVCAGNCSTFTGQIKGVTPAGAPYTATAVVDFWYYHACGGGRGGGCHQVAVVTGGSVTVQYQ